MSQQQKDGNSHRTHKTDPPRSSIFETSELTTTLSSLNSAARRIESPAPSSVEKQTTLSRLSSSSTYEEVSSSGYINQAATQPKSPVLSTTEKQPCALPKSPASSSKQPATSDSLVTASKHLAAASQDPAPPTKTSCPSPELPAGTKTYGPYPNAPISVFRSRSPATSGVASDPHGYAVIFHNGEGPHDELQAGIAETETTNYGVLSLGPGQGGTFGFTIVYKNEHGEKTKQGPTGSVRLPHLWSYGNKLSLIGTKSCVTCIGVYFEIQGNRCFCAHINAWPVDSRADLPWNPFPEGTKEYNIIKADVTRKMKQHSKENDWSIDDVCWETLVLVCPYPQVAGNAVTAGIGDFFSMSDPPKVRQDTSGFIMFPGLRSTRVGTGVSRTYVGNLLKYRWELDDPTQLYVQSHVEDISEPFREIPFIEQSSLTDHKVKIRANDHFTYTVRVGWHHAQDHIAMRYSI